MEMYLKSCACMSSKHLFGREILFKNAQQYLSNMASALCLPPDPFLAPGTIRCVAAAVLLAVSCGREILIPLNVACELVDFLNQSIQ